MSDKKPKIIKRAEIETREQKRQRAKVLLVHLLIEDLTPEQARKVKHLLEQKAV